MDRHVHSVWSTPRHTVVAVAAVPATVVWTRGLAASWRELLEAPFPSGGAVDVRAPRGPSLTRPACAIRPRCRRTEDAIHCEIRTELDAGGRDDH